MKTFVYTAVAAVISLAAGAVAAQNGLWIIVVGILAGWLRWTHILIRLRFVLIPQRLAKTALDDGWRDPDWDKAEYTIRYQLLAFADGNRKSLVRAIRYVGQLAEDVGRRQVAVDRLQTVLADLERDPKHMSTRRWIVSAVGPTSWAMGTGGSMLVILSEYTPGPVLGQPWRIITGLAAAGGASSLLTMVRTGDRHS